MLTLQGNIFKDAYFQALQAALAKERQKQDPTRCSLPPLGPRESAAAPGRSPSWTGRSPWRGSSAADMNFTTKSKEDGNRKHSTDTNAGMLATPDMQQMSAVYSCKATLR